MWLVHLEKVRLLLEEGPHGWPETLQDEHRKAMLHMEQAIALKPTTSLNKEVRPLFSSVFPTIPKDNNKFTLQTSKTLNIAEGGRGSSLAGPKFGNTKTFHFQSLNLPPLSSSMGPI